MEILAKEVPSFDPENIREKCAAVRIMFSEIQKKYKYLTNEINNIFLK